MLISYARSSSLGQWSYCEMAYFLIYNLGFFSEPNVKTVMGSAAHKVLECLALAKLYIQNNPDSETILIEDDSLGKIEYDKWDFFEVHELTQREIDDINKSRMNKSVYKDEDVFLKPGATRFGVKVVEDLIKRSNEYYSSKGPKWQPIDFKHVANFVWMATEWNNGQYDVRKRNIVSPECSFDIALDEDWAYFHYLDPFGNGEDLSGQFAIKGTIDLITKLDDDTIEIIDWKTGQRFNWATGKIKDYDSLCKDPQLMLYYFAFRKMFPQYKNIILTIVFIRDGGPYMISFDFSHEKMVKRALQEHFFVVQSTVAPKLLDPRQKDFRCEKLCHFYKNKLAGSSQNICKHISKEIELIGIDEVIKTYKNPDFEFGTYQQPGE